MSTKKCPKCGAVLTELAPGRYECPSCKAKFGKAEPTQETTNSTATTTPASVRSNYEVVNEKCCDFAANNSRAVTEFFAILSEELKSGNITLEEAKKIYKNSITKVSNVYKSFYETRYTEFLEKAPELVASVETKESTESAPKSEESAVEAKEETAAVETKEEAVAEESKEEDTPVEEKPAENVAFNKVYKNVYTYASKNMKNVAGFYELLESEMSKNPSLTVDDAKKMVMEILKKLPQQLQGPYKTGYVSFAEKFNKKQEAAKKAAAKPATTAKPAAQAKPATQAKPPAPPS